MSNFPEEAIFVAAAALFAHRADPGWDAATRAQHWLRDAPYHREDARVVLTAALPLLGRSG